MPEDTPTPETEARPLAAETPAAAPAAARQPLPQSVIILGAIAVILLVVVLILTLQPKPDSFSAEIRQAREENERLMAGLGLAPSPSSTIDFESVASRIVQDTATLTDVARNATRTIGEKDAELAARNQELNEAQQAQKLLTSQIVDLRREMEAAGNGKALAASLQAELDAARARIGTLGEELQQLRPAHAALQQQVDEVTRAKEAFERQVRELQIRLAKMNLFANSESQIIQEAQALYRSLLSLEDKPETELSRAYSQYATTMGATTLGRLSFASGSAELSPEELEKLSAQAGLAPANAIFFVVGYASETGDVEHNRTLSSTRATAVADALAGIKQPEQKVQAAYLGQTDRFGPTPDLNQVCEIWQIAPGQ